MLCHHCLQHQSIRVSHPDFLCAIQRLIVKSQVRQEQQMLLEESQKLSLKFASSFVLPSLVGKCDDGFSL